MKVSELKSIIEESIKNVLLNENYLDNERQMVTNSFTKVKEAIIHYVLHKEELSTHEAVAVLKSVIDYIETISPTTKRRVQRPDSNSM